MQSNHNGVSRRSVLKKGAVTTSALVIGGVASSGTAAAGIGDGRVGHYPLNDLRGRGRNKNKVYDVSPYDNTGIAVGDVSVARGAGRVRNAFEFDGDGDFVEVSADPSFDITSEITVAAWAYLEGSPTTKQAIVSKDWNKRNSLPYVIDLGTGHADQELSFGFFNGNWYEVTTGELAPRHEWFHVTGVFDNGNMRIYLNGNRKGETAVRPTTLPTNNEPLLIGRRTGAGTSTQDFAGKIDDVRVYNRALSDDEIDSLATMGSDSSWTLSSILADYLP